MTIPLKVFCLYILFKYQIQRKVNRRFYLNTFNTFAQMNKKPKHHSAPLETIKENPGNEESFINNSESKSKPQDSDPKTPPIQPEKPSKEKSSQPKPPSTKQPDRKPDSRGKKKKTKSKAEDDRPKINISTKALQEDFKIIQEHHEYTTSQMVKQFREQKWSEQNIALFLKVVNAAHSRTFKKINKCITRIPGLYSEEIAPVQIAFNNELPRNNKIALENYQRACDRVAAEKPVRKPIHFSPKLPPETDILLKDGSVMRAEDYAREKAKNPELEKIRETVKELEAHCNETQKKFIDTIDMHQETVKDLERELNAPNPSERSVKKRQQMSQLIQHS